MSDDPEVFAKSIVEMYGPGAEAIAKEYAQKHKLSGDGENHALWLRVAEIIQQRRKT